MTKKVRWKIQTLKVIGLSDIIKRIMCVYYLGWACGQTVE